MRERQNEGIFAEEIKSGTMINGQRVVAMTTGVVNGGQRTTSVRFQVRDRKGRKRLSEPVTYVHGTRVPGTRPLTTWAMPAGPVGRTPGGKLHGGWWGDPDASDGRARTDRHHRMINSLTYSNA